MRIRKPSPAHISPFEPRTAGWLATALLLIAALMFPAAPVLAEHTIDLGTSGTDQSGLCEGDYLR